jgi:thioredoxin reductase (NADPH)
MYDVVIIGKGPAGISASLYTSRSGLSTLIIGQESTLSKSGKIDNYYGFEQGISGSELLRNGEVQTKKFNTEIVEDEVIALEYDFEGKFTIKTKHDSFNSRAVLLASGSQRTRLPIKNVSKFEGKGVHYCTTCDGYFYRDKKVGMLGYNEYALNELNEMKHFTGNITVLTNGNEPVVDFGEVKVNTKKIKSFEGEKYLQKVVYDDDTEEEYDGIFAAYGSASSVDFAKKLGIPISEGIIEVDKNQKTNLDGLYAAGDCASKIKQVSVAVGQGAVAGLKISEFIRNSRRE